jgi:ABC-type nitrate/sulfonate/bicarbonate transport system substrate-binding protein
MHTDEYVAAQEGFYAQNGLNVKIKIFESGSDVTKAMQAGTVKFGSASTTAVPAARAAGVPLKLMVGGMNDATSSLYDGPLGIVGRADRGITTKASSLKGKKIGVLLGSTTEQYLRIFLEKNGLTEKDVKLVNLQVPDHPVSLKQGDVDAVASWEPYVSQEISELGPNAVVVSRGEGLLGYIVGLGVLDPTLQNNNALVLKFVTAVAEADAFIRKNPQKAAQDAANYLSGLNVNLAADAIKNHMKWDPRLSVCTQTAMKAGADELFKAGQITTNVPVPAMMNTSIIGQVEKDHPAWFADLPPVPASC